MTQEVIAEIYNLDKIESGLHAMQTLEELKAHPILSKRILRAMQQADQQRNLAAVEKLYNSPLRRIVNLYGHPIQSSRDLANVVIKLESNPIEAFFRLKEVFMEIIEATPEDVAELVAYAIHDIYMMDDEQYIDFLRKLLRTCGASENGLELRVNALFEEYKSKYPN